MTLKLGTLVLRRPFVLPDAHRYRAVYGYVEEGPVFTRMFSDPKGRTRVLSAHNDDVAAFGDYPMRDGVFNATEFTHKQRIGE